MEHGSNLLQEILLLLVLSFGSVAAFRVIRLPPILGYLLVGAITSKYALGWLPEHGSIEFMGEVGVVFLLFAIGLEFSVRQFLAMRTVVLGLGGLQVLLSALSAFMILYLFDLSWKGAIIAAGALALSSTAIVVKQLNDQGEMRTRHGQLALGILLFQDLAVVPFLIVIPLLSGGLEAQGNLMALSVGMLLNLLLLGLVLVAGHKAMRPLFHAISSTQSQELFNITVLLVSLTAAWVTQSLGLSLALGAFLAGMLLSETEYKHQIESEIRPFRDILMGLFFISVGAKLDLSVIPALWFYIVLLVLGLTVGKALLIAVLTRLFGEDYGTSLRTGVALAQGGEFGFALLSLALSNALLSDAEAQAVLAAIVISMALAPILLRYNDRLSRLLFRDSYLKNRYKAAHQFSLDVKEVENHVIICGFRRVGQSLARFLEEQGIPYLALDLDPTIVKEARDAGSDVHYADSSRPEILVAAGIYRARILVVTLADLDAARLTVEVARRKQASIPILVRTRNELHIRELEALGATEVLPELLESGIMVAERVMKRLELPLEEINGAIERTRKDGYSALISYFRGESPKPGVLPNRQSQLHTIVLKPNDRAVGMSIAELGLGSLKLTVKSLRRGDIRGDHPSADMVLQAEDVLVLEGLSENLQQAQKRLFGERKTPHRDKPQPVKA